MWRSRRSFRKSTSDLRINSSKAHLVHLYRTLAQTQTEFEPVLVSNASLINRHARCRADIFIHSRNFQAAGTLSETCSIASFQL